MSFANPEENIKNLGLQPGHKVADFGSGVGHYTFPAAKIVGTTGHVYAVDVLKEQLERLRNDAKSLGLKNIDILWGDVETVGGTKLGSNTMDAVIVSNILFQVESNAGLVHECERVLKVGGRVLLVDWSESFGGLGPKANMVVDAQTAQELFENGGFELLKTFDAGAHHYGLIFKNSSN